MANLPPSTTKQRPSQTRLYIQTLDNGAAPCAPPPSEKSPAFLSLAICKPVLRGRMQAGDVIIGLSGAMIAAKQGYPKNSVIYSAIVDEVMPGKDYFSNTWAHRLDCIYRYDQSSEQFVWIPTTKLHATSEEQDRDIGGDNAKVLICRDFRYFGKDAVEIPSWAPELRQKAKGMGRGRPMFTKESEEGQELERLHQYLWSKRTKYTPTALDVNGPRLSRGKVEGVEDEEMEENEEDEKAPGPSRSHKC